jgi:hypothetical protein
MENELLVKKTLAIYRKCQEIDKIRSHSHNITKSIGFIAGGIPCPICGRCTSLLIGERFEKSALRSMQVRKLLFHSMHCITCCSMIR